MTPAHCRAARGWLRWTQQDLAERSGVSRSSILWFENHSRPLDKQKATQIGLTFRSAGISFTDRGIEFASPAE